jgi:hypothetical protein
MEFLPNAFRLGAVTSLTMRDLLPITFNSDRAITEWAQANKLCCFFS